MKEIYRVNQLPAAAATLLESGRKLIKVSIRRQQILPLWHRSPLASKLTILLSTLLASMGKIISVGLPEQKVRIGQYNHFRIRHHR